jgi:hypothetical protein
LALNQFKGFFAVRATKEAHVAEYFGIAADITLSTYETARAASGKITADFACDGQFTTTAGMPGSLDRSDTCGAITFASERPAVWGLPFPVADVSSLELAELIGCGMEQCELDTRSVAVPTAPTADAPTAEAPAAAPTTSGASKIAGSLVVAVALLLSSMF